jgi:ATP-dependent RNA helicase SrmB
LSEQAGYYPPVIAQFSLHPHLLRAAEEAGFIEATAVQSQTIPQVLLDKDLIVCSKTGSGKTAAFMLPALHKLLNNCDSKSAPRLLILLPTRELALQTRRTFETLARHTDLSCVLVIGGETFSRQRTNIDKQPEVIIATPGRLVEHIVKATVDLSKLDMMVLDEADRILELGFAPEVKTITKACPHQRQTLLFSATLSQQHTWDIATFLHDPQTITIDPHQQSQTSLIQQVVLADDLQHKKRLVIALLAKEQAPRSIIFCNTRKQCQALGNALKAHKLRADFTHGELSQRDRKRIINQFRSGQFGILVATDVAARGIDIQGITLVINFNVALSVDDHIHRVGRTARAGRTGTAISLVDSTEWNQMSRIERHLKTRFTHRKVSGLVANYRGPVRVKSSGKAAGRKKLKARRRRSKVT